VEVIIIWSINSRLLLKVSKEVSTYETNITAQ